VDRHAMRVALPGRPGRGEPTAAAGLEPVSRLLAWRVRPPARRSLVFFEGEAADVAPTVILGTMHIGTSLAEMPAVLRSALDNARILYIESNQEPDAVTLLKIMQLIMLPPGESLRRKLGDETWAKLVQRMGNSAAPAMLDRMRPTMVAVMMQQAMMEEFPGQLDMELVASARESSIELGFLEDAYGVLKLIIDGIPEEDSIEGLREALDMPEEAARVQMQGFINAYRGGDSATLKYLALFDDSNDVMLKQRNRAWMPAIRKEIAAGNAFIAFGAAHLYGEFGILPMLAREGYRIEHIEIDQTEEAALSLMPVEESTGGLRSAWARGPATDRRSATLPVFGETR
jgi:uncharacterized protein YbaP (TraB family)